MAGKNLQNMPFSTIVSEKRNLCLQISKRENCQLRQHKNIAWKTAINFLNKASRSEHKLSLAL